jgi:uncharacterized protein YecT (DUF1311 family)
LNRAEEIVTRLGRSIRWLLVLGLGYFIGDVFAQNAPSYSESAQQADSELNKTYQQVMKELQPKAREQLRSSQRAWLTFVEQNTIALRSACSELGWTQEECNADIIEEVATRTAELPELLGNDNPVWVPSIKSDQGIELTSSKLQSLVPSLDAELNVVYQRCLHAVPEEQAAQLRQAQRAWIAYRDATRAQGIKLVYYLLLHRIDHLNSFYSGPSKVEAREQEESMARWEQKADPSIADPFERARKPQAIEDTKNETQREPGRDFREMSGSSNQSEQPNAGTYHGEKYPQTRTRLITEEEAAAMIYAQLRYAVNEVYARHGANFGGLTAIQNQFRKFTWYQPRNGVSVAGIESEFSDIERANVKMLAKYRDRKR